MDKELTYVDNDETLVEELTPLQSAEAETNFMTSQEYNWLERIQACIAEMQYPSIILRVAQEVNRDQDNFQIRNGQLTATFIPVSARLADVQKTIGREQVYVPEILIEVRNKYLTVDNFDETPRSYYVRLSDLFNGFNVVVGNPRVVRDGEIKGYYAASISNGRAANSNLVRVLNELATAKHAAYEERRGRGAGVGARRQADVLTTETKAIARDWFLANIESIDFWVPSGDLTEIYDTMKDPKPVEEVQDAWLRAQAQVFNLCEVDDMEPDLWYTSADNKQVANNIWITWRAVSETPEEKSLSGYAARGTTCTIRFKAPIKSAPEEVKAIIQDAKFRSKKANNEVKESSQAIVCLQLAIMIITYIFDEDINFLRDAEPAKEPTHPVITAKRTATAEPAYAAIAEEDPLNQNFPEVKDYDHRFADEEEDDLWD